MIIVQGVISKIMTASGITASSSTALPQSITDAIENCGFWESISLWAVTLIGGRVRSGGHAGVDLYRRADIQYVGFSRLG